MTRAIPLSRGYVATVDDEDYERVISYGPWHVDIPRGKHTAYARKTLTVDGRKTTIKMHVFILGVSGVDHANGNGLDNRRANLRAATNAQNSANRRRRSDNTSGFKGVSFHRRSRKWQAYACQGGKQNHLGYHATAEQAARAYDEAARELFGPFARLNFPQEQAS